AREEARRHTPDLRDRVLRFADNALATDRRIDRLFWLLAAADDITHGGDDPAPLLNASARRIHATPRIPYRERLAAVRILAATVVPLACSPATSVGSPPLIPHHTRLRRRGRRRLRRIGSRQTAPGDLTPHMSGRRPRFPAGRWLTSAVTGAVAVLRFF